MSMIRYGKKHDYRPAQKLAENEGFKHWASKSLDIWSEREGSVFVVADEDNRMAGFILIRSVKDEAEILVICVDPKYRNLGIATQLIKTGMALLEKQGIKKVFLEVSKHNIRAYNLYKKMGFEVISVREKYYNGKVDAYVMRREI